MNKPVLMQGDCLIMMQAIPDNSIDSIVTDPPYGLNDGSETLNDIFIPKFFDVFLPKFYKSISKFINNSELISPLNRIPFLNSVNRSVWVDSGIGVPESSIDFYDDFVDWNEEIKNTRKSTVTLSNRVLGDKINIESSNNSLNFYFKIRPCVNSSLSDLSTCGFTKFGFGSVSMAVIIPFNSKFASFLRTLKPTEPSSLSNIIGLLNNSKAFSKCPASVVTSSGTELRTIFTFNTRDSSIELSLASTTSKFDAVFEIVTPKNIGAFTGTSGLSSMFKSYTISTIGNTTNRTFSINLHKFMIPYINKKSSGFMGKKWDYEVPSVKIWKQCLRVLKPGGHLLSFAGTKTQHRMCVNIEDAGFEIRDMLAWIYGTGFPKSLNIGKSIDEYKGWGTALKPALEPITLARKPLLEGTILKNVLKHGTGGINIDDCRVGDKNRFPANLIHDGSKEILSVFPNTKSGSNNIKKSSSKCENGNQGPAYGAESRSAGVEMISYGDQGSASRFFYCAKTSKSDRHDGCDNLETVSSGERVNRIEGSAGKNSAAAGAGRTSSGKNHHPTVKPNDLMRYLCRLITPPTGTVLDPFMGSGSTGKAAIQEQFSFIGIELDSDYFNIAQCRINHVL